MKKQHSYNSKKVYSVTEVDIPREKMDRLKEYFLRRKDTNDYISIYNAVVVMKEMGFGIDEKKKLEIVEFIDQAYLKFDHMKKLFNFLNKSENSIRNSNNEKSDYADAFIAVGGEEDLTGSVSINEIKEIFQNFKLELSINSLLEKNNLTDCEDLDFSTFCKLFSETLVEESKSLFSLISVILIKINLIIRI